MRTNTQQTDKFTNHFVDGNEALDVLKKSLYIEHGQADLDNSLRIAGLERELLDAIVRARKSNKITQKELADNLRTKPQQLSKYERGQQAPSLSVLLKLCDALNLELTLTTKETHTIIFHT